MERRGEEEDRRIGRNDQRKNNLNDLEKGIMEQIVRKQDTVELIRGVE